MPALISQTDRRLFFEANLQLKLQTESMLDTAMALNMAQKRPSPKYQVNQQCRMGTCFMIQNAQCTLDSSDYCQRPHKRRCAGGHGPCIRCHSLVEA